MKRVFELIWDVGCQCSDTSLEVHKTALRLPIHAAKLTPMSLGWQEGLSVVSDPSKHDYASCVEYFGTKFASEAFSSSTCERPITRNLQEFVSGLALKIPKDGGSCGNTLKVRNRRFQNKLLTGEVLFSFCLGTVFLLVHLQNNDARGHWSQI